LFFSQLVPKASTDYLVWTKETLEYGESSGMLKNLPTHLFRCNAGTVVLKIMKC
jgi:hypothetical protein